MQVTKLTHHSAAVCAELLPSGVLSVRLTGVVTAAAALHFYATLAPIFNRAAFAFVADYRRAAVTFAPSEMLAAGDGIASFTRNVPAAIVVQPSYVDQFVTHAAAMALRSTGRRVFTDWQEAMEWAEARVTPRRY